MFSKVRNRFLLLNLLTISIVMLAAFAAIYFVTYNNMQYVNQNKLSAILEQDTSFTANELFNNVTGSAVTHVRPDSCSSFTLTASTNGDIKKINSLCKFSVEEYAKAAKFALRGKKGSTILLGEGKWQYAASKIENDYYIAFLDVTDAYNTLNDLAVTLIIITFAMFFVIFAISSFFANLAIKPMISAWEKQKRFVADASHELKTPISIITANYDALLANKEETIESQIKWLDYIKLGTDRMTKLTGDLLSLAKLEDEASAAQNSPFDLSEAVRHAVSPFENAIWNKEIQLHLQIEPNIIAKSDYDKIYQAITILLDNAVKYTDENGQIELSLKKTKRYATLLLANTGKGIPAQDLPKIFNRFYRADPSRTQEKSGYGLGLAIAKRIVDSLGGGIQVKSQVNETTVFKLTVKL